VSGSRAFGWRVLGLGDDVAIMPKGLMVSVRRGTSDRGGTATTRMMTPIILVVQWSCRSLSLSFSRG
jgi:hypothetical protein